MQIGDTLAEERTTRVNTYLGTSQTVLLPSAFLISLGGVSALGNVRRERHGKGAIRAKRDIAILHRGGVSGSAVVCHRMGADAP